MLKYILKISRPRFWLYLAGPFIIGYLLGINRLSQLISWKFLSGLLFFLIPANVFLYGVNDYFDYDTDRLNPKKRDKEQLVGQKLRKQLVIWLFACTLLFVVYAFTLSVSSIVLLAIFFLLSLFYSAPPLRFKSKPFIDSISNVLYFMPGLIIYNELSGMLPSWLLIIGFACWTAAMHLYSAIPDIKFDKKAGLKTTAIVLGKNGSLWACLTLWIIFFLSVIITVYQAGFIKWYMIFWLLAVYPLMIMYILIFKVDIIKVYWYYPYITAALGFIISLTLMISKY